MNYEIQGGTLPVVIVHMDPGEKIICEGGGMSWMTPNMKMETSAGATGGGLGKLIGRMVTGEGIFQNIFTCEGGPGLIAFTSSFPGNIIPVELAAGQEIICQKSAFLAATNGVTLSAYVQKNVGAGFLGGEGFLMQRITGPGLVFLEIDGSVVEYDLAAGQAMVVDQGYLATMDGTCSMDIVVQKGIKNMVFGGDGITNSRITGPGKIRLQTMPAAQVAGCIIPYLPKTNN